MAAEGVAGVFGHHDRVVGQKAPGASGSRQAGYPAETFAPGYNRGLSWKVRARLFHSVTSGLSGSQGRRQDNFRKLLSPTSPFKELLK